ncbi:MAG TPA: heavy-metal-associated domain-containing protein [Candidatus Poseidoniales archaeon]|jgi:copper chaperone CopZ|nr:heavy-metal-associated domain-containing protein [Candidatus Poseidoniales archaeon]
MSEVIHNLTITGMTCGGCSGRVTRVLEATPGIISANISHEKNSGVITTTSQLSTEDIVAIVNDTGFNASA